MSNLGIIKMNEGHDLKQQREMTLKKTVKQKNKGKLIIEENKEKRGHRGNKRNY